MDRHKSFTNAKEPFMLQQRVEDLILYSHTAMEQFPRKERYTLCARIDNSLYEMLHLAIAIKKKFYKHTTLRDFDIEIYNMRSIVKLADRLKYISHGKMNDWLKNIDELGMIVGGLMKTFDK